MRDPRRLLPENWPDLAQMIRSFIDGIESEARIHADLADVQLSLPVALLAFHVAREAVMNAVRHSASRDVWVSLSQGGSETVLTTRDHGVGFDAGALEFADDNGLALMRERTAIAGGVLEIRSLPPTGTIVRATFPT